MTSPALLNYKLGLKKGVQDKNFYASLEKARRLGMGKDTILAHINPDEATTLARTRGMMINPRTGLPQFGLLDILGGVLGGIGGFLFGGPAGAVKGFGIGSTLGGGIEGMNQEEPQEAPSMMMPPQPPKVVRKQTLGHPSQYIPGSGGAPIRHIPITQTEKDIFASLYLPIPSEEELHAGPRLSYDMLPQYSLLPNAIGGLAQESMMRGLGIDPHFQYKHGGYVHGGFIDGDSGGQTDDVSVDLPQGAYVMDATTVSLLGDGNTQNGVRKIEKEIEERFLKSGVTNDFSPSLTIKAKVSDGEHIIPKEVVTAIGGGNNPRGARILDGFRRELRKEKGLTKFLPPKTKNVIHSLHKSARKVGGIV